MRYHAGTELPLCLVALQRKRSWSGLSLRPRVERGVTVVQIGDSESQTSVLALMMVLMRSRMGNDRIVVQDLTDIRFVASMGYRFIERAKHSITSFPIS
jgi:hypothetical protein